MGFARDFWRAAALVTFGGIVGIGSARADTPEQLIASWRGLGAVPGGCQEQGCEARTAIADLLEKRGYCYIADDWHPCNRPKLILQNNPVPLRGRISP